MKCTMMTVGLILAMMIPIGGCKTVTANTPPAAMVPGAQNEVDGTTYEVLVSLHAFVDSLSKQAAAGTFTPTPAEKILANQLILDVNATQILYAAYHGALVEAAKGNIVPGAPTEAQVKASLAKATADQSAYAASVTAGAK